MKLPAAEEMEEKLGYSARSLSSGSPITGRLYSDLTPVPDDTSGPLAREFLESRRTKPADCHGSLLALPLVREIASGALLLAPYPHGC